MTGIAALFGSSHPHISGATGAFLIVIVIALALLFGIKRRGWGIELVLAIVGVLIIVFGLMGGVHLHSVPIPGH